MKKGKIKIYLLVFLIVAFGFFLRIYNIDNAPPGIYPDEAMNGEDAIKANWSGDYKLFYEYNNGREGFFINFIAICFSFLGISILTLKLPAIIFSTITIWGTYLFTKELFTRRVAFVSSFLVATSFWAMHFGRIAFRANMLPAILVFSFYFLFKGLRTKKWWDFAAGGAIFGLGMHSYISWRIAPMMLIVFVVFLILSRKDFIKNYWKSMLIFLVASLIIATPMFYTFYQNPEFLDSRSDSVSIFSPEVNGGSVPIAFLKSFSLSLIKYNFVGDMNWRHNFRPYPLLDPIASIAFIFGIVFSIMTFIKLFKQRVKKKLRSLDLEKFSFLLIWFFAMLAPEFLTAEGNPHALRAIGTLPVVFIFAGIGFEYLFHLPRKSGLFSKKNIFILAIAFFFFIGIFNTLKYHVVWANKERVAFSFNKNLTDMSKYMNLLSQNQETYVITDGSNTLERLPIWIFHNRSSNHYLVSNELNKIKPKDENNFVIFLTKNDEEVIQSITNKFPQLQFQIVRSEPISIFYILRTK